MKTCVFELFTLINSLYCELQITYTIMFSLTNALVQGAQGPEQMGLMLALDTSFCQEFQQLVNFMNFHYVLPSLL